MAMHRTSTPSKPHRSLSLTGIAAILVSLAACGGADTEPVAEESESAASGEPAAAVVDAGAKDSSPEEVLQITHSTPLLPKTATYDKSALAAGLIPSGEGIWFTLSERREKRSVDRHIKGFELIAQSFESKFRDSRRSVVLRVVAGEEWKSPLLSLSKKTKLTFSYMPYLPGMGGFLFGLDWGVWFEVQGAGDRSTRVELWSKSHLLRPPTGGTWREVTLDVSELAGRQGRFVFSAVPTAESQKDIPHDLVAAFANPTLSPTADTRPNVLVISIDTLRKDAISPYGADREMTPNLQGLAERGVVADQFWSTAPWTLPSYASFFTAEYPSTHGAGADRDAEPTTGRIQGTLGIATGIPSLVSHFRDQGYRTQSFYSNGHLNLRSGVEKGFDGYVWYGMTGRAAVENFHEWTNNLAGQPFFAFVQMTDPHWPYVVPRRFAKNWEMPDTSDNNSLGGKAVELFADGVPAADREDMTEIYGRLVQCMDDYVGGILRTLEKRGLVENTLVIFHTDHGEELWDHGEWWHGHTHHAELENVSLILSWPGHLPQGTRLQGQVRAIDILPTALDLVGLPPAEHFIEGRSLAHLFLGEEGEDPPPALQEAELYGPGGDFALTDWPWRLLVQPVERWTDREVWKADPDAARGTVKVMLFNIEQDPGELNNLAEEFPERVAGMRTRAEGLIATALERRVGSSEPAEMSADADAGGNLSVLGYAGDQ